MVSKYRTSIFDTNHLLIQSLNDGNNWADNMLALVFRFPIEMGWFVFPHSSGMDSIINQQCFPYSWNQCSIQRLGKCNLKRILCGIGQHKWVVVTVVFTWSAWQFPSYFRDFVFFLFAVQNCTARKLLECVVASTKELEWDSILTPCANWFYNEFSGDLSTNRLAEGTFCDLTWFSACFCLLYYVQGLIKT